MKILGTGLSGLVGTRVMELLPGYQFDNLSLETGFDITDREAVLKAVAQSASDTVLHMAAFTNVDGAEKEKDLGEAGTAWKVNVAATGYLAEACQTYHKRLLYISTDFVFSGKKAEYHETDIPDPISWYGRTKYEGEILVAKVDRHVIMRISYPYRAAWPGKPDFLHRILEILRSGQKIPGVTDQLFVPTLIDDIARSLEFLLESEITGVVHSVGEEALSPYDAAIAIAEVYGEKPALVEKISAAEFYKDRAKRPLHAVLKNDTMAKSGFSLRTFSEGLAEIRRQEGSAK